MPVTSIKNSLALISTLLIGCLHTSHATKLKLLFLDGTQIEIRSENARSDNGPYSNGKGLVTQADKLLTEQLLHADDAFTLNQKTFFLGSSPAFFVIVRIPSDLNHPDGRCGAGHEDYILLVSIHGDIAKLEDRALIQSCLKDISLVSDKGDHPRNAISYTSSPETAVFQSMSPPDFKIKNQRMFIKEGKLEIVE